MIGSTTIFFDTETAGTSDEHATIQIAAVAVRDWQEVGVFEAKLRFDEAQADPEALALNHYDRAVWEREALVEGVALLRFASFCRGHAEVEKVSARTGNPYRIARLAGHNVVSFDAPRLVAAFKRSGAFLPAAAYECLDTLHLARWMAHRNGFSPKSFKLADLCEHFGIALGAEGHDALADVRATVVLARELLELEYH